MLKRPGLMLLLLAGTLEAQEFERAQGRWYQATGTFTGTVSGTRNDTLYNGDVVQERIDCRISMRFDPDGTVHFSTSSYLYEKHYFKKTTTGGFLVGHTLVTGDSVQGSRRTRLRAQVTQYDDVWDASWTPRPEVPGRVLQESWLTDGRGRTWGHSKQLETYPTVYCEPRIFWRNQDGKGPGLPRRNGSYQGPDVFRPWATVTANWNFSLPGRS
jgi:hypothetical protein